MPAKYKHRPCPCGCGELADECMRPGDPFQAFQVDPYPSPSEPNDAANSQAPECSGCGAPPGQAHGPTCRVEEFFPEPDAEPPF